MKYLIISLVFVSILSCKKESVLDEAPSIVGIWKHYSAEDAWHIIYVNADGNGTMEWYTNDKLNKDTKERPWLVKSNTLYFGKVSFNGELYDIDEYPVLNTTYSIESFDTLEIGKRFVKLDGYYYTEQ